MSQHDEIKTAYRMLGNEATFYDGMITCSTLLGKVVCGLVWNMDKEKNDRYLERALSGIPQHFSGRLLFRERTDTGMYLQTGDHGSRIKHPILQQHLVSGRQKILYQKMVITQFQIHLQEDFLLPSEYLLQEVPE